MAQTGSPTASSLFTPLGPQGVLIKGEQIRYNERRHWAILIQPCLETLAVLIFITLVAGGLPSNALGAVIILGSVAAASIRARNAEWNSVVVYAVIIGLLIGFVFFGIAAMASFASILAAGRFLQRAAMWAFFERLYITNRRVILAKGFLGARIASMPLTRVTDVDYKTTVPGEILHYGELRVETAGQDQALSELKYLDQPANFYEILTALSTAAVGSVTDEDPNLNKDEDDGSGTLEA